MESEDDRPSRYSQKDLSAIVTHLSRIRPKNRARLANSDLTRAFLNSALALADEAFHVSSSLHAADTGSAAYLSRPKVLDRTKADFPELVPTEAKFRDRWAGQQDFLADFVSYALDCRQRRMRWALQDCLRDLLESSPNFSTALYRFADEAAKLVVDLPGYRIQLLATASAAIDPDVSEAIERMYKSFSATWMELYRLLTASFGFKLRTGVNIDHFTVLLVSTIEGVGLRLLAGLQEPVPRQGERKISIPGTAALALFMALTDAGDGLALVQAADTQIAPAEKQISPAQNMPSASEASAEESF